MLRQLAPEDIYVEMHPRDAEIQFLKDGDLATVQSRRGSLTARVALRPGVGRGRVFIPMHYEEANRLTFPAFDPESRQPAYKACAVRVSRAEASA